MVVVPGKKHSIMADKKRVPAPKGFHWMKGKGGSLKLMKDPSTGYKKHTGSSKFADFPIQKVHRSTKKK